jgi:organic radical activating enzyme
MSKKVSLIENISTFQGEGPDSGRAMLLLRFKKCNMNCEWCDTKVKMRNTMNSDYELDDIQKVLDERQLGVMVTGGEPTFLENYDSTVSLLNDLNYPIANVETNGCDLVELTREVKKEKNVKYIYSPKIFNQSDFNLEAAKCEEVLFGEENVYYKIVIDPSYEHYRIFLDFLSKNKVNDRVYLMAEGVTKEQLVKNSYLVFDLCEEFNFNFSSRTHIMYGFI